MKPDPKSPERHAWRMAKKQEIMRERIANADKDQGILLVLTGPGKGKSSSGFGMLARALGHGMKVGVVQFIKGAFSTGEEAFFRDLPNVDYHVMGEGYTWDTQDREKDVAAASAAWEIARKMLQDDSYHMVLLDEPTAGLDVYAEAELHRCMQRLVRDRTAIIISHRFSTVMDADRILVLDQGKLAEQGTHLELLAKSGIYSAMWHVQRQQAA